MTDPIQRDPPDEGLESLAVRRVAARWLVWQHGMDSIQATEVVNGRLHNSRTTGLREEAIEIGIFVADGHA
jgi:hypothetical protein